MKNMRFGIVIKYMKIESIFIYMYIQGKYITCLNHLKFQFLIILKLLNKFSFYNV